MTTARTTSSTPLEKYEQTKNNSLASTESGKISADLPAANVTPAWVREFKTFPNPVSSWYRYHLIIPVPGWRFEIHVEVDSTDETDTAWVSSWPHGRKVFATLAAAKLAAIDRSLKAWKHSKLQAEIAVNILDAVKKGTWPVAEVRSR